MMGRAADPEFRRELDILTLVGAVGALSDAQLLQRFLIRQDESSQAAFTALVDRHASMVMRVCWQVLGDSHDAQDAFQATFLVLARKAGSVRQADSVASWLHGVALRVATRAKADAARRKVHEGRVAAMKDESYLREQTWSERWPELHEAIARLPEHYREPVVLCYLEGLSAEAAAQRIGCPRGTVLSRLSRAKQRLRARLSCLDASLAAVTPVGWFSPKAELVPVPRWLTVTTARSAAASLTAGTTSSAVTTLVEGVVRSMKLAQLKVAATVLAVGIATAAVVLARQGPPPELLGQQRGRLSSPALRHGEDVIAGNGPGTALVSRAVRGRTLKGHASASFCVAFSPDGKVLASGGADRTVRLWDAATGAERVVFRPTPRRGQHAAVMALAFSPDNALLATACDDLTIRLHDVASGEERRTIPQGCFANTVAFAPDGQTLAWAGTNPEGPDPTVGGWKMITLWDMAAKRVRAVLAGHADGISSISFSDDGTTIATGSYDGTVKLWQAGTGKELATLTSPRAIHAVAFSPDGKLVAAAMGNRYTGDDEQVPTIPEIVKLWDVASRRERATLAGHEGSAHAVAFSPDGKILATGGRDGLVTLWDVERGEERASLKGHRGYVYSLAFSPDGKMIASSGLDSTVRLWQMEELISARTDPK